MRQNAADKYPVVMQTDVRFRLRHCGPGDEERLALVGGASFLEAFAGVLDAQDIMAHCAKNHSASTYAKYLGQTETRVAIAEVNPGGAPVGYIVCCEPDLPVNCTTEDYELRRIYLLHRFQGKGIGKALMDQAVAFATALRKTRLMLGVYGKNHEAIRFYEKSGFTVIGERYFTVGSTTHHDAVMARSLG